MKTKIEIKKTTFYLLCIVAISIIAIALGLVFRFLSNHIYVGYESYLYNAIDIFIFVAFIVAFFGIYAKCYSCLRDIFFKEEWIAKKEKDLIIKNMFIGLLDKDIEEIRSVNSMSCYIPFSDSWYLSKEKVEACIHELDRRKREKRNKFIINNIMIWMLIATLFFWIGTLWK
ncbi:hypothetical protein [uncultured Bacteroides sp.]|uniref:hypothetical protein n=1 Tax=uncultured Bacteroides sp. TaxID=162156 RepID=UPI002AA935D9|nr:hypothetical protein [uncultured Bacteroides sp.]